MMPAFKLPNFNCFTKLIIKVYMVGALVTVITLMALALLCIQYHY